MLNDAFFVSATLHQRTVKLPDGSEHILHFKEVPAVDFRKFYLAQQSGDEQRQAENVARLIAASLCNPDGKQALTVEKALTLKPAATNALFSEVLAVNAMGGGEPGNV